MNDEQTPAEQPAKDAPVVDDPSKIEKADDSEDVQQTKGGEPL